LPERLPGKGLFSSKPFRKKCPANRGLGHYGLREINGNNVGTIDKSNFESIATCTF
jgi:hypothetical protein